jgi:hypothetical protein
MQSLCREYILTRENPRIGLGVLLRYGDRTPIGGEKSMSADVCKVYRGAVMVPCKVPVGTAVKSRERFVKKR